jgi:hypothetical protein
MRRQPMAQRGLMSDRRKAPSRICHCPDCGQQYFEDEFRFVRQISELIWAKKRDATIVVYPHYFSGAEVPGLGVRATRLPLDPRWTLMFTAPQRAD